jgi:hypothetical protein
MAVHAEAEVHDTPLRPLDLVPLGVGVGWTAQVVPFHRSASIMELPLLAMEKPTAVQAEADVQDTATKFPDDAVAATAGPAVVASTAPAPRATAAETAAYLLYLLARHLVLKLVKIYIYTS